MTTSETETTSTIHYHVGWNMPGYLPEMEPYTVASFQDGQAILLDSMEHAAEHSADCDDHDTEYNIDTLAEELAGSDGPEWDGVAGGLAYWIQPCTDDCELEGEDM